MRSFLFNMAKATTVYAQAGLNDLILKHFFHFNQESAPQAPFSGSAAIRFGRNRYKRLVVK